MPFIKLDARKYTYHPPPRCFNAQHQIIPCPPLTGKARIAAIVVCSIVGALVLASAVFYFCQWCCCCCCRRKRKEGTAAEPKEQASDSNEEEDARPLRADEQRYQFEPRESEDTVHGYADDKSSGQYDYDDMDRQLDGMFKTAYDDDKSKEESSYSYPPIPMPSYAGPSYAGPSYGGRAYAGGANI